MRAVILLAGLLVATVAAADPPQDGAGFPRFQAQEIDTKLGVGYGVVVADLNGDGKPDLAVADKAEVVWYENPGKDHGTAPWKKRTIGAKTKGDHVALTAADLDGDGKPELVVLGGWGRHGNQTPNPVYWLKPGKGPDDPWAVHPIPNEEPSVHRVRVIHDAGKPAVALVPLMGRGATEKGNWLDGRPVRVVAYRVPADPTKPADWKPVVLSDELHVCHGFGPSHVLSTEGGIGRAVGEDFTMELLAASYEGVSLLYPSRDKWKTARLGEGNQANPKGHRGASEVAAGWGSGGTESRVIAAVEPWHGNQVVVYTPPKRGVELWDRHVIDDQLRGGHAVAFADLDGERGKELVVGVRDDADDVGEAGRRCGVRVYRCTDGKGAKWDRLMLDPGGVGVEDLTVADLNGDRKPDIIAVGRQTTNVKIYWNQGR